MSLFRIFECIGLAILFQFVALSIINYGDSQILNCAALVLSMTGGIFVIKNIER